MKEVTVVSLNTLSSPKRGTFTRFIDAALAMERGKAVLVDVDGLKSLNGTVNNAISCRGLKDKLAVRMIDKKVYIIHRADK